ncbi:MAG TPA: ribosome small subunit-dependent GTPase A [Bacteroidia bacterium]|nr:ribosome small subunit-dependent GTPase A [Bacteroidia bacterium]
MKGIVIKSTGNWYAVLSNDGQIVNCRIKGRLRIDGYKSTNPIAVGDRVIFEKEATIQDNEIINGVISEVEERKNCIIRKSKNLSKQSHILATNIDMAMLVVTLAIPKTSFGFIDRFLATAEAYRIPSVIIFNKADIFESDEYMKQDLQSTMQIYENIGYKCFSVCSVSMDKHVKDEIISLLKNNITLISGHSGVGKSTFINAIEPALDLRTQNLSDAHLKGMHTTTFTEMHALSGGGFIIDTPGIKEFSVINMDKSEIFHFFPEIFKISAECKFSNCLHINEPKCAVIEAVSKNIISPTRYHSYLSIMNGEEVIKEYDD